MAQNISVPDIGDFKDVEVIEILVKPGDQIKKNDPVVTIESDKSSVEIPSPSEGEIKDLKVKIGDKVSEGSILATIENGQETSPKESLKKENPKKEEKEKKTIENINVEHENTNNKNNLFIISFLTIIIEKQINYINLYEKIFKKKVNMLVC